VYQCKIRQDEAIILIGVTPPSSEYFGFTYYLSSVNYEFGDVSGGYSGGHLLLQPPEDNRTHIQASIEDPINASNINVTSDGSYYDSFDKDFVMLASGDAFMFDFLTDKMITMGIPSNIFNYQNFPREVIKFGLEREADTIGALLRTAFFHDPDDRDAYMRDLPISLLRITPKIERAAYTPIPRHPRKSRSVGAVDQSYLRTALMDLVRSVKRKLPGTNALESRSLPIDADPDICIDTRTKCFFENTDAAYFGNLPGHFFSEDGHFVVVGVNHAEAGYARYSSVTLYDAASFISVASVTNTDMMKGSADRFLPDHPLKDQLYAISFRRNCTGYEYCTNIPENRLGKLQAMIFMSRAYLDPNGTKGSDPSIMLPFRVLFGEDISFIPSMWKSGASGAYKRLRSVLFPDDELIDTNTYGWPMP